VSSAGAEVRGLAERLVKVVRRDDVEGLSALLTRVVSPPDDRLYEPVLAELVTAVVRELRRDDADEGQPRGTYTADLVDADHNDVPIDEVDPALRAVLRAVLAQLNGDVDDARFQLSLVAADPEPLARLDALWHALLWVSVLDDSATDRGADPN
jgi:hypothetical protein